MHNTLKMACFSWNTFFAQFLHPYLHTLHTHIHMYARTCTYTVHTYTHTYMYIHSVRNKEQMVDGQMSLHYHLGSDNFRFARTYFCRSTHVLLYKCNICSVLPRYLKACRPDMPSFLPSFYRNVHLWAFRVFFRRTNHANAQTIDTQTYAQT